MEQQEQKPNLFGLCRAATEEDKVNPTCSSGGSEADNRATGGVYVSIWIKPRWGDTRPREMQNDICQRMPIEKPGIASPVIKRIR